MKIVKPTPNRLRRLAYNLLKALYTVLYGSVFVFFGLVLVILAGEQATLTCQRVEPTQGSCQFVTSGLLGSDETTIPLNRLRNAKLELITDSRGRGGYSVVLLTDDGKVPFISMWNHDVQEKQKKADLINVFIGHPEETYLRVQQDDRWSVYSVGGVCILGGGLVILSSLRILIRG
jgi:hypothetical protein